MAVGTYQGVAGLAPRLFTLEEETGTSLTNTAFLREYDYLVPAAATHMQSAAPPVASRHRG